MNQNAQTSSVEPLDLSKWRNLPVIFMVVGGLGAAAGFFALGVKQFAFSWLVAYMCFLSLCVGGLFLVIVHHMFDASWSVPTRRACEHLACLAGLPMLVLFLPIALLAKQLYVWMNELDAPNHSLHAKFPLFTIPGFYIISAVCFGFWFLWSNRLRYWSLEQDKTGAAECTRQMRWYACSGVVGFALTVSAAAIMWMKALMYEWFSTMYGVAYFASSVWVTLATVYVITLLLQRTTRVREVARDRTYYMLGSLLFAFTVFWAYVNFAQYFIIWNANVPEETFWFVKREAGTWFVTGAIILIFGHFFVPFLGLLRIDVKLKLITMLPLCAWAWLMQFIEMEFQITPALHPDGFFTFHFPFITGGLLVDIACFMFIGGALAKVFLWSLARHEVYPVKDPRMAEALEVYVPSPQGINRTWTPEMNTESTCKKSCAGVYTLAALGTFLVMGWLVWLMRGYTQPPSLAETRGAERRKIRDDQHALNAPLLDTYAWQDPVKDIVRVPVKDAKELILQEWQDPAKGYSILTNRAAKAFAPAAPPVNKYE